VRRAMETRTLTRGSASSDGSLIERSRSGRISKAAAGRRRTALLIVRAGRAKLAGPILASFAIIGLLVLSALMVAPAVRSSSTGPHILPALSPSRAPNVAAAPTAHPPTSARSTSSPTVCSGIHPSEFLPARPAERAAAVTCALAVATAPQLVGSVSSPRWALFGANPPPFQLYNFQVVYDTHDGYLVLFGNALTVSGGPTGGTETWSFIAGHWSRILSTHTPESCPGSVLAYDSVDGYVVYLAGANIGIGTACSAAGQTWKYQGGAWTHLHPLHSPSARQFAALTNDSRDGYLVLFGGMSGSNTTNVTGFLADTWKFVGGNWTQIVTSGPSARFGAGMTYDAADRYVVLFGGSGTGGCQAGSLFCMDRDTWNYSGGTWTKFHPSGAVPPEPNDDGLVYDAVDKVVLYTVPDDNTSSVDPMIYWTFHGGNWSSYDSLARGLGGVPPNRLGEGLAYDWRDGYAVLFGGTTPTWAGMDDTWSFHGLRWSPLSPFPRAGASVANDPTSGSTILFGGYGPGGFALNDTWSYANGSWTEVGGAGAPPARGFAGMTFDGADGYLVLSGGCTIENTAGECSQMFNDTWKFHAGSWSNLTAGASPSPRAGASMTYSPYGRAVLLFGGFRVNWSSSTTQFLSDSWRFHAGRWTVLPVGPHPSARAFAAEAFDPASRAAVLFGGCAYTGAYFWEVCSSGFGAVFNDTWMFHNGSWRNHTTSVGPSPRITEGFAYDSAVSAVVLFGGVDPSGSVIFNDTWEYRAGHWTQLVLTRAPVAQSSVVLVANPSGAGLVLFESFDASGGVFLQSWKFS
jgi:hypothetical protein